MKKTHLTKGNCNFQEVSNVNRAASRWSAELECYTPSERAEMLNEACLPMAVLEVLHEYGYDIDINDGVISAVIWKDDLVLDECMPDSFRNLENDRTIQMALESYYEDCEDRCSGYY